MQDGRPSLSPVSLSQASCRGKYGKTGTSWASRDGRCKKIGTTQKTLVSPEPAATSQRHACCQQPTLGSWFSENNRLARKTHCTPSQCRDCQMLSQIVFRASPFQFAKSGLQLAGWTSKSESSPYLPGMWKAQKDWRHLRKLANNGSPAKLLAGSHAQHLALAPTEKVVLPTGRKTLTPQVNAVIVCHLNISRSLYPTCKALAQASACRIGIQV